MKKIDLKSTLEERVQSTEWTDQNTWNVLDRIRAAGKTTEKRRRSFLLPAAALVILALCIGITSMVNPGTPDRIRESAQTVQPLALAPSGEEIVLGKLKAACPGIAENLKPVNAECTEQGVRIRIVSALVRDHSSWMLWTLEDLEGNRINETTADILADFNNVGELEEYGYYFTHYSAEENKLVILEELRYSAMNDPEDGMYSFRVKDLYAHESETVDLKPLLEQYGNSSEGIEPPETAAALSGSGLKVLDYTKPLDISLSSRGKLLLTGIGWIGSELHVQIHEADPAFCDIDGQSISRLVSVGIFNASGQGVYFDRRDGSPFEWTDPENPWDRWQEFVLESTPADLEGMTLNAEIYYNRKAVKAAWEFTIPVSAIRDSAAPADSESGEPDVADDVSSLFLTWMYPENTDSLIPVGRSHEKDGIRTTVHSARVNGQEASILLLVRDLESSRVNTDTRILAEFSDGTASGWRYDGCRSTEYDTEKHIFAFLLNFAADGDPASGERTATLKLGDLSFYERTQTDLLPLVQQYAPANGDGIADVDIPLHETASLTRIGWAEGRLYMELCRNVNEFPMISCKVAAADSDGNPVEEDRLTREVAVPGKDPSLPEFQATMNVSPNEMDRMQITIDFRNPAGTVEDAWEVQFPVTEPAPRSCEEAVLEELRSVYPEIAEALKPVNETCERDGIRMEIVSALVRENESWVLCTMQDLEGGRIGDPTCEIVNFAGNIGEGETIGFSRTYCDPEAQKTALLVQTVYSGMNQPENGMYTFAANGVTVTAEETVDLKPLLEEYGKTAGGIEPPEDIRVRYQRTGNAVPEDLKVLDYMQPLDIPLTSKGKILLTGIGWIGSQLHVQIHEAEPSFAVNLGGMRYGTFCMEVENTLLPDYSFLDAHSPYDWDGEGTESDYWAEYVFDSTPEDVELMSLEAKLHYQSFTAKGVWGVRVPASMIRADE